MPHPYEESLRNDYDAFSRGDTDTLRSLWTMPWRCTPPAGSGRDAAWIARGPRHALAGRKDDRGVADLADQYAADEFWS